MSLPSPIIQALLHFRPAFSPARPTRDKARGLVAGTILARGQHTVTAALKQMSLHNEPDFTLLHQVLNKRVAMGGDDAGGGASTQGMQSMGASLFLGTSHNT